MFMANCRISILRGTYTDPFGDQVESDTAVYTGIPASIREVRSDATTLSEGTPRQIRFLVGRVPAGTDVRHEDRLRDEDSGHVFFVDAIDLDAPSPIMEVGTRLELRRVS